MLKKNLQNFIPQIVLNFLTFSKLFFYMALTLQFLIIYLATKGK